MFAEGDGALAITPTERARLLRETRIPRTQASTQRADWIRWGDVAAVLGQPWDVTRIPFSKLEQMRRDPMIAFGRQFIVSPIVRSRWYIESEKADVAAATDWALRRVFASVCRTFANSLDFGCQPAAKRFELVDCDATYVDVADPEAGKKKAWDKSVQMMAWRSFIGVPPQLATPRFSARGEFNGFDVTEGSRGFSFGNDTSRPDIGLDHALWVTNERESVHGSLWGYPRIGYALRYWWSYWFKWYLADRAYERYADPPTYVYHPDDSYIDPETGEEVNFGAKALEIGENMRAGDTVALPSGVHSSGLDDRPGTVRKWEIGQLEAKIQWEALNSTFEYMDVMKLRSMLIPEQSLIEGKGGTSSRNVAGENYDAFLESEGTLAAEWADQINRYMIRQFVQANWGPDVNARMVITGFDPQDVDTMRQVVQLIGQMKPESMPVDEREVLRRLGVPLKDPDELAAELKRAAENARLYAPTPEEAAQGGQPSQNGGQPEAPPAPKGPVPAQAGSAAGVTQTGEYYDPPGRIVLAERWPKTRQYSDSEVRRIAESLAAAWRETYAALYDDFASHIAGRTELAEGDEGDRAGRIVRAWKIGSKLLAHAGEATLHALREVMARAAERESQDHGLAVDWDMDNPEARAWIEQRGAELVSGITDTVRGELRAFLSSELEKPLTPVQIADDIRSHFSQFPGWKADRLARTEIAEAYNAATLLSYRTAGIGKVQAFDGSGGLTGHTDASCVERNGRVFTLDEAMAQKLEHPNCTLGWRPFMASEFSVRRVPSDQMPAPGVLAHYDPESEELMLSEEIGEESELEVMLRLGDRLARR